MLRIILFWLGITLLAGPGLRGQTTEMTGFALQQNLDQLNNQALSAIFRSFNYSQISTKGSPYWNAQWRQGEITWLAGGTMADLPCKIMTYEGTALVVKRPQGDSVVVPITTLKEVRLYPAAGQDTIRFRRVLHQDNIKGELLRVLHEGQYALLARQGCTVIPPNNVGAYNPGRDYQELVQKTEYFLYRAGSGVLVKCKPGKKGLLEILTGQDAAVQAFVKAERLSWDAEKDLVRIFAYYEKLQNP